MKILEIIPQLSQGGAERFVIDLCNELAKEHEVVLVVLHNMDQFGFFRNDLSERVRVVSMNKRMGMDWKLFFRLAQLIRRENPDVVHTHLRAITYLILSLVCRKAKPLFIHTIHSDAKVEAGTGVGKWCRRWAFGTKRVCPVTISEESQRSFENFYCLPAVMIYNGRPPYHWETDISAVRKELEALKVNKHAEIVINVARIDYAKNQLVLAKAIDQLNREGYAVELVIIGNMADRKIVDEIEILKSPYVHLLDVRKNPRDYMRAADAFCLSSIYEGMPITLIECFSVGTIPLCTPVGGIINMIEDGRNGLLAQGSDQKDLEKMLKRFLLLDMHERELMQRKAKDAYGKFSMNVCALRYIELIKEL